MITGRLSDWVPSAPQPGIGVFASLFFVEAMARASVATVIPLQTYALVQEARYVSYLSFGLAILGLVVGLSVPLIIRMISRRWTFTLGAVCLVAAAAVFVAHTVPAQVAGIALRNFGTWCLNISVWLYIMDYVRKHEYVRNDSMRMAVSTVAWTIGPFLGVWLYERYGALACYGYSALWAFILIAFFWYLRMQEGGIIIPATKPPENPFKFIPRFVAQPRLMLAWSIAVVRSSFWSTLFIYAPILMKKTGQGSEAAGILISLSQILLVTALFWGRFGMRQGLRFSIALCFGFMGLLLALAGLAGEQAPILAAGLLVLTAFFATGLDALGGTTFYRAVRARERAPMAAVYRTFLEVGDLVPNLVYGIALIWLDLGAVFLINGLACLGMAVIAWRYIPRSM